MTRRWGVLLWMLLLYWDYYRQILDNPWVRGAWEMLRRFLRFS